VGTPRSREGKRLIINDSDRASVQALPPSDSEAFYFFPKRVARLQRLEPQKERRAGTRADHQRAPRSHRPIFAVYVLDVNTGWFREKKPPGQYKNMMHPLDRGKSPEAGE